MEALRKCHKEAYGDSHRNIRMYSQTFEAFQP